MVKRFFPKIFKIRRCATNTRFDRIILYYGEWQSGYRDLDKNFEFREGLPQNNDWVNDPKPKLIIIDDLMRESSSGGAIVNLFMKGSHHNNLRLFLLLKTFFIKARVNVTYL